VAKHILLSFLYHGLDADIGHWEIVLNALATEIGIGYAYNPNSDFGGYFTVDLH